jgi:hypothetical protein
MRARFSVHRDDATLSGNAVKHFLWPISPEIGGGLRAPADP